MAKPLGTAIIEIFARVGEKEIELGTVEIPLTYTTA